MSFLFCLEEEEEWREREVPNELGRYTVGNAGSKYIARGEQ